MKLNFRRGSAFASQKAREYLKDKNPQDITNITVIRHAAIGDFMNIRPFLIELREFFPNAKVTLSVLKHYMYGIPYDLIDEVHVMSRYKEDNSKTGFFTRVKEAKTLPPQDIIFDLTDSTISLFLVALSKSKLKVGYPYRALRRTFFDVATLRSDFVVEAVSVLHMLNILGAKTRTNLEYGLNEKYPKREEKRIIYFAGASTENKCWEKDKFRQLIEKMSQEYKNYEHVILQGIGENEKFLEIYEPLAPIKNVALQETMSIEDVMQFLSDSRCLVSNDTGIRNIGIALQTPTVGIFFQIPPFRYWPREAKHDCVFNIEYSSPTVDDVYASTKKLVDNLYEK
ncbi:glycosyltransferase family 9 protein [Sulfurimonas autotrophica]|uniref:Glycosyl transferase family 9 n=1 Tax=Sulfurimonas autotrophica (strain ATCC BAA-671 / DSM 16294 / JCM 11897 / OK10) TaxID=563040 RepID=E0UV25_SULAO|nr:glycosyltransferase family 9 protein [Sulfurimonas autotrophica]ADN09607.1 glycosyl transferase family 9 [Sulfurimonas autotrophica DSM 16294]